MIEKAVALCKPALICRHPRDHDRAPVRGAHRSLALAHGRFHFGPAPAGQRARHRGRVPALPADHPGRRPVHPGRPVRGLGGRRCHGRARQLRGRGLRRTVRRVKAPAAVLHARQPRLPGRPGLSAAHRHGRPGGPHRAPLRRPAHRAQPRRPAVPRRCGLPALSRAGAQQCLAARPFWPSPWPRAAPRRAASARRARPRSSRAPCMPIWMALPPSAWLQAAGASTLVHGHTHRPAQHTLAPGLTRVVLSDWDAAALPPRLETLRLSDAGLERIVITPS